MIIVIIGVAGAGKTLIGSLLAADLGWPFLDADDFHPAANVAKMRSGMPLRDEDRAAWLDRLCAALTEIAASGRSAVLACSALKRAYRERLAAAGGDVRVVYLKGSFELIDTRLRERKDHYFGAELLPSQFAALEEPDDAVVLDIDAAPQTIVRQIRVALHVG